jgi:hypothetical protein
MQIFLSTMVTNASGECSFSKLKFIKIWTKNSHDTTMFK